MTDPIIALIATEKRWRLLAVAARARAERLLFALPRDERPEEFDDQPIMAEAVSLETRAVKFMTASFQRQPARSQASSPSSNAATGMPRSLRP
jgi:hypothetical protein